MNKNITFSYRNWRGEVEDRTVIPINIWFGHTVHHPVDQWFLTAYCTDRRANRDFAMADILIMDCLLFKINTLFDAIKHGDPAHQAWLKSAIDAHFACDVIPEYTGAGPKDKPNMLSRL